MKKLDEDQQDIMYLKRRRHRINFDDLAITLNCTKESMVDAQLGKEIPDDVHSAVVDWLIPQSKEDVRR